MPIFLVGKGVIDARRGLEGKTSLKNPNNKKALALIKLALDDGSLL